MNITLLRIITVWTIVALLLSTGGCPQTPPTDPNSSASADNETIPTGLITDAVGDATGLSDTFLRCRTGVKYVD